MEAMSSDWREFARQVAETRQRAETLEYELSNIEFEWIKTADEKWKALRSNHDHLAVDTAMHKQGELAGMARTVWQTLQQIEGRVENLLTFVGVATKAEVEAAFSPPQYVWEDAVKSAAG